MFVEREQHTVCKCSMHGGVIYSVVAEILRDCIDWPRWRLRYHAEGHLCVQSIHTDSDTSLESPYQWIEIESNHMVKSLYLTDHSPSCPCKVHCVLMTEKGFHWQLSPSLPCREQPLSVPCIGSSSNGLCWNGNKGSKKCSANASQLQTMSLSILGQASVQ